MRERYLSGILCCGLVLASCTEAREVQPSVCFDFDREVAPALEASCLECHQPGVDDSIYYVDTLANIYARDPRTGASRLDGGADSPFLVAVRGDENHEALAGEPLATLTRWVVDCRASTVRTEGVHPRGWVDAASDSFHGRALASEAWDFRPCVSCHGQVDEPGGGESGVSCVRCHAEGPTTCTTCHGDEDYFSLDPEGGLSTRVHRAHLQPGVTLGEVVACEECHVVPADWREPGHVWGDVPRTSDGTPRTAEVELSGLAAADIGGLEARRLGPPTYENGSCSNVYCHGHTLGDEEYVSIARVEPAGEANCELCHGMPPAGNHAPDLELSDCVTCHGQVVDADGNIIDASLHLDGELSIGDRIGCTACHGQDSAAPPPSLSGETDPTVPGVGAHAKHLEASALAPAMPCSGCHLVPAGDTYTAKVVAAGHMDTALPAEVFADPSGLAFADGAQPTYDPATNTCSNAYCHGGGEGLLQDASASVTRELSWVDDAGSVFCGRCHGIAPDTPGHPNVSDRTTCRFCHPATVSVEGEIIVGPDGESTHINGAVDLP